MSLQWADESFEFHTGLWKRPATCLAVQPGVVDFPARCVKEREHPGERHHSTIGLAGGHPTEITYWDNDDE